MNRGLALFLVFLALVALGLTITAVVLGPNVLAFVFHDERADAPFTMVDLVRLDGEDVARRYEREYAEPAMATAEAQKGRRLWRASTTQVVAGAAADHWSGISLVEYPSRATFIDLATSAEYRQLSARRDDLVRARATLAGTPLQPFDVEGYRAFVVRLVNRGADASADWWRSTVEESAQLLDYHRGAVVWRASLNPLVADPPHRYDHMVILGFLDAADRKAWLDDPARGTLHSLQRRYLARDVLLSVEEAWR